MIDLLALAVSLQLTSSAGLREAAHPGPVLAATAADPGQREQQAPREVGVRNGQGRTSTARLERHLLPPFLRLHDDPAPAAPVLCGPPPHSPSAPEATARSQRAPPALRH